MGKFEKTLYIGSEDFSEYVTLSEKGASGKTTVSLILQGTTGLLEGEDFTLSFMLKYNRHLAGIRKRARNHYKCH